jgi:AICAR transformylase/IMP cyclohydrolase PurH
LRGAAKNHGSVAVISKVTQYDALFAAISAGGTTLEERRNFALEVFRTTAEYDLMIASWLGTQISMDIPDWFGLIWKRESSLRYGENPHQNAAIYRGGPPGAEVTREELLAFYQGRAAKWQIPDDVVFLDNIPLGATGKMQKSKLRDVLKDYQLPDLR